MTSIRDQILNADDLPTRALEVPEWGCTIHLRSLTGAERDGFEGWLADQKRSPRDLRARFAALVIGDEKGERVFTDADIPRIANKSARALERIRAEGMTWIGYTEEEIKEIEGNSESVTSADSGSA